MFLQTSDPMVDGPFHMWSTIPRRSDNISLVNTGIRDIINALGTSTTEGNKLLVQDERNNSVRLTSGVLS